jgi:hypothetical protein
MAISAQGEKKKLIMNVEVDDRVSLTGEYGAPKKKLNHY